MYRFCVFAGTTEGRELVEFLLSQGSAVTACVATEYGEALLPQAEGLTVSARRMNSGEMAELLRREDFTCCIDATHPYAPVVTEEIVSACRETGTEYLRLLRRSGDAGEAVFVADIAQAVDYLNHREGNILLTTGSKEITLYTDIQNFQQRAYARVLPMESSLQSCQAAGLAPSHILAMQGPFSREMDLAMLRAVDARYLVTKDTGVTGGFSEKLAAAREAGVLTIVVGRPPQRHGLDLEEMVELLCRRFGMTARPVVSVVGIGPGGSGAMTEDARRAIRRARCIIGAERMLAAVGRPGQRLSAAIAPQDIVEEVARHRACRYIAVALSGDVGFFSGAKKLLPLLTDCDVEVVPGLSSLVVLCSRLGTSYEDVVSVSVHGRSHNIVPDVRRHRRVFTLVGGEGGMSALCRRLTEAGLGDVRVSVGERLGYPDERITVASAGELAGEHFHLLSVALLENPRAGGLVVTHGLPDSAFLRGEDETGAVVPMTKSEVRSVALSKLALTEDAVCWDIGAGTGSVAVEMALQACRGQVYAVERNEGAVALLRENRERFALENLTVVSGSAPEACRDLPAPTHVFIGGSSGNLRAMIALLLERNPGVRLVVSAISLESISELTECMKEFHFTYAEAVSLAVARDKPVGAYHLMLGQNPVYLYTFQNEA